MNTTIRSTERALSQVVYKARVVKDSINKASRNRTLSQWTTRRSFNSAPRSIFQPRIKLREKVISAKEAKYLSTTIAKPNQNCFYNPSKPSADELCDVVTKPIIPLTQQVFPKGQAVTPSVTKVLSATMPAAAQFLLDRWKETMIKRLGVVGFANYQKETFERGRLLHALIAKHLLGVGEAVNGQGELKLEIVQNLWKSIQNVVKEEISNVRLVEHVVSHPDLNYRGIVDCVAFYRGELVVIDFKTSEKQKKNIDSLYDNPIQVSAYCGAINNDKNIPTHVIDRNICSGLVIVAYIDGSEASTHYLNKEDISNKYWELWTTRLDQYSRMGVFKQVPTPVSEGDKSARAD